MFEKKKVWLIYCSTGCTCCSSDNFYQGFYETAEEAQSIIDEYKKGNGNPLSSLFAEYGKYSLMDSEVEILPDGRVIVENEVYGSLKNNFWS